MNCQLHLSISSMDSYLKSVLQKHTVLENKTLNILSKLLPSQIVYLSFTYISRTFKTMLLYSFCSSFDYDNAEEEKMH